MRRIPTFRLETIYTGDPSELTLCVTGDLNQDGEHEIVLASRRPTPELFWLGRERDGTWARYDMDDGSCGRIEAGGCLFDLDGDGDLDFIAGQDGRGNALFWWECPKDPRQLWTRRLIFEMPENKSHDQLVADIDGDGKPELYFWNQKARTLWYAPVPDDPRTTPWPHVHPVATGVDGEGLVASDVDGDGRLELIAGDSWYRPPKQVGGPWERFVFAEGFITPRLAAADLDGDGKIEIVLSEGDASLVRREDKYGRAAILRQGDDPHLLWEAEILHDRLVDPHSLIVADFDGDGRPDVFVGELGDPNGRNERPPGQRVYLNRGDRFEECVIAEGLPTHEARLITLGGRRAIVCKPYRNVASDAHRPVEIDSIHLLISET